jgi:hypothetical protein
LTTVAEVMAAGAKAAEGVAMRAVAAALLVAKALALMKVAADLAVMVAALAAMATWEMLRAILAQLATPWGQPPQTLDTDRLDRLVQRVGTRLEEIHLAATPLVALPLVALPLEGRPAATRLGVP